MFRYHLQHCKRFDRPDPGKRLAFPLGARRERKIYEGATNRELFPFVGDSVTHRIVMPIRPENRWLYPIDWRQLSQTVRFDRAGAKCEGCSRPHLRRVVHLGDGRWWDADIRCWRSDRGKRISMRAGLALASVRVTYVVLACAHLDHDPGNSASSNLKALCQRCHMIHDAAEHRWQRWWNVFRLRAIRDLYEDPRVTRERIAGR
jgi:hypothetical protein